MIVFGLNSSDLESIAPVLEAALNVRLMPREGYFHGGNYYSAETAGGTIRLQYNRDIFSGKIGPIVRDWPVDRLVLSFEGSDDTSWELYLSALSQLSDLQPTRLAPQSAG
ncbi:MAG TPA: hypothetical protein VHE33_14920 [Acidobacteriaceae bacterium]|nr:hypothetical protein [Acidobacteriaceae bacterium]